jgi:hypothetical protein
VLSVLQEAGLDLRSKLGTPGLDQAEIPVDLEDRLLKLRTG